MTGSYDKTLKVVDISMLRWNQHQSGDKPSFRKTYQGHRGYVSDGVKSPSHVLYVSAASDGELRFFNADSNEADALTHSETLGAPINSIDFISSNQLACAVRDLDQALIFDLKRNCNYQLLQPIGNEGGDILKLRFNSQELFGLHSRGLCAIDLRSQR